MLVCAPRSRAISSADFPVSTTIRTAPARNSASYEHLFPTVTLNFPSDLDSTLRGQCQAGTVFRCGGQGFDPS
ncbi:hypothetical protein KNE206_77850 [Kitasatospora sp. NE20-6]